MYTFDTRTAMCCPLTTDSSLTYDSCLVGIQRKSHSLSGVATRPCSTLNSRTQTCESMHPRSARALAVFRKSIVLFLNRVRPGEGTLILTLDTRKYVANRVNLGRGVLERLPRSVFTHTYM